MRERTLGGFNNVIYFKFYCGVWCDSNYWTDFDPNVAEAKGGAGHP